MKRKLYLFLLFAWAAGAQVVYAQSSIGSGAGYYNYTVPGDVTVRVKVWGSVRPGLYEVKQGTNLSTLLTLAGGPPIGGSSEGNWRKVNIQLVRGEESAARAVYQFEMENTIIPLASDPVLQNDDMVTVETFAGRRFNWRDVTTIIAAAGSLTLLTLRVLNQID